MLLQRSDSIAANAYNPNVLSGQQFEFAPQNVFLELGTLAAATGVQVSLTTGKDVVCIDQLVNLVRIAGQGPQYPDDYLINDVVGMGQRIIVAYRNTQSSPIIVFTSLKLTPI